MREPSETHQGRERGEVTWPRWPVEPGPWVLSPQVGSMVPPFIQDCGDGSGVPLDFQKESRSRGFALFLLSRAAIRLSAHWAAYPQLLCWLTSMDCLFRGRTRSPWWVSRVPWKLCLPLLGNQQEHYLTVYVHLVQPQKGHPPWSPERGLPPAPVLPVGILLL